MTVQEAKSIIMRAAVTDTEQTPEEKEELKQALQVITGHWMTVSIA